ncbi:extradiol dioxygenase [Lentzea aerocolonigenes]|uniref:Extradiol dioxygenase n=1 Tax=Lentzea aerocolonigenes TaxID=68170 RepID=A0A0F0GAN8_LENAE|nr:VOC family protein [Lentzea aerocolonigenes]KJK33341.1 extradiol dioxygenase [Lentzea aerocolonigenes]
MAIQPIIITPNLGSVQAFYEQVLGAVEVARYPEDGPVFYKTLQIGDAELGLVAEGADTSVPPRITLSIDVADVNALLPLVEPAGGRVLGPSNDMPWGQRVAHVFDPDGNPVNLTQSL